jgi:hypothetical protein
MWPNRPRTCLMHKCACFYFLVGPDWAFTSSSRRPLPANSLSRSSLPLAEVLGIAQVLGHFIGCQEITVQRGSILFGPGRLSICLHRRHL